MADKPSKTRAELLELVMQGKDAWNVWAAENKGENVDFSGHIFDESVSFAGFYFTGAANFNGTTFTGNAHFNGTTFPGYANFGSTTFTGYANFDSTTFTGNANFDSTTFTGNANFNGTTFTGNVHFNGTTFTGYANFDSTTFTGYTYFERTTFTGYANFESTTFTGYANFGSTTFTGNANFESTTFTGNANFTAANFESIADFTASDFALIPRFKSVKNPEYIVLDQIHFNLPKPDGGFQKLCSQFFGICSVESSVESNIRTLRGIANKTYAIDVERDLGILERNAMAGAAWASLFKKSDFRKKIGARERWRSLLTGVTMTPLLVIYRWSSNYGRSVLVPLLFLFIAPVLWFFVYFKLYLLSAVQNTALTAEQRFTALKSIAMSGALPIGNTLRPVYTASLETLFGSAGNMPLSFQIALTFQNIISLILIFLSGLALRNFFRLK